MVKIHITAPDGTVKQYSSVPLSMGTQKAIARYGRDAMTAAKNAKSIEGIEAETTEDLERYEEMMADMEKLADAQMEIVLRAFGGQFGIDELENAAASEVRRVIAELQAESYGIVRKNG